MAILVAGCGGSTETAGSAKTVAAAEVPPVPHLIKVSLNAHAGAENVGLFMADKLGYFDDLGGNMGLATPAVRENTVWNVLTRMDEFGLSPAPQVAIARENGYPIVAVGSIVPSSTAAVIWLKGSGIRTLADLKGKTIGFSGIPFTRAVMQAMLKKVGLAPKEVETKQFNYRVVQALLTHEVDAIVGSPNIEGLALKFQGAEPVVKRAQDFGIPAYDELAVIAREDRVATDPELIRGFLSAVERGTAAAIKHPRFAAKVIINNQEADPRATLEETEAQLKATLPLLSRTGRLNSRRAAGFLDWMYEEGLIRKSMPASEVLAGQP